MGPTLESRIIVPPPIVNFSIFFPQDIFIHLYYFVVLNCIGNKCPFVEKKKKKKKKKEKKKKKTVFFILTKK